MGFQILDEKGQAIKINDLDKEACEFWKVDIQKKYYASPPNRSNWFDTIGYNIHSDRSNFYKRYDGVHTWKMVKESLLISSIDILEYDKQKHEDAIKYLKPFFELIDYWENKGYTAKQTK